MRINRRKALAFVGWGATAATPAAAQGAFSFRHGVASGDPLADRVVIWTRISGASGDVAYRWRVDPVGGGAGRSGGGTASAARDHTAKVDVTGLAPGKAYTFQFEAGGAKSPVGRTRTLPVGPTKDVVLAVASCTLYPNGYFNAYSAIADLPRVDAVLHLGDYIYEYGGPGSYGMNSAVAGKRPHDPPHECVTLEDYRRRHAQYKADADTQAAHARAPWIVVWDDHETANDSWSGGAENHQPAQEGDWAARKAAALRAYYEWMPLREPKPGVTLADAAKRTFQFGDLASLIMVETRLTARGKQLTVDGDLMKDGKPDVAAFKARLNDAGRQMMGPAQEAWLSAEVKRSVAAGHAWQVLGNQVVMAQVLPANPKALLTPQQLAAASPEARARFDRAEQVAGLGVPTALDMWNGYPRDRERVYAALKAGGGRPIVVSGDSHSFWANELHDANGARVAVEFGTTGVTSPGAGEVASGVNYGDLVAKTNKEVIWNDQVSKGFVLLTLTREAARADMVAVSTITERTFTANAVKRFRVTPQGKGVSRVMEI